MRRLLLALGGSLLAGCCSTLVPPLMTSSDHGVRDAYRGVFPFCVTHCQAETTEDCGAWHGANRWVRCDGD